MSTGTHAEKSMNRKDKRPVNSTEFYQEEFVKLAQLCRDVPFGLAIFDRDLRYIQMNARMAAMDGKPVEHHIGKTIKRVDRQIAAALEPIVRQAMEEGEPQVDLETEILRAGSDDTAGKSHWLISCFPLTTEDEEIKGAGVFVQDITELKQKDVVQDERLKFEALLSSLSAALINVPVSEVDRKIEQGLQKVVDFLGFDRSSVWHFSTEERRFVCSHSYSRPGCPNPPTILPNDKVPVWTSIVRKGEMFRIPDVDELPDDQWREKEYCRELGGIKSMLFIPSRVGGTVVGLISFVSYRVKRAWPNDLIQRLRLLWEVFSNALERKRADQKIQKALAEIKQLKERLEAENLYLRVQIDIERKHEEIIGQSDAIQKVFLQVDQVANTDSTVLILGETGTGKELVARAIHALSPRKERSMIKLNCAALPSTLIEAELFGREKGAYTGAMTRQIGRFEAAHGSTIFLDEIGDLPLELQSKLLRVLQEGQFERLGSSKPIKVDVRVLAATNRNLIKAVQEGRFREDLYYRLNVFPISVPPLRERREDIPLLVWALVKEFGMVFGKTIERIPKKNMDALVNYSWPGNIRELRNMVERAMILSNSSILIVDLPDSAPAITAQAMPLEDAERAHILFVLERTGWRVRGRNGSAEVLKLKPSTLESKMKKLGIKRKTVASEKCGE